MACAIGDDLSAVQSGRPARCADQRADGTAATVPTWRSLAQLWPEEDKAIAMSALEQFDMASIAAQRADQLSGGQQQRVAIARALVQQPDMILADEPIASLDPRNTRIVMDALLRINKHFGITVVCNLHSLDLARSYCDRLIGMASGRIVFDGAPAALTDRIARELYDLEADEVMGGAPEHVPATAGFLLSARSPRPECRVCKSRTVRDGNPASFITANRRRHDRPSYDFRRCGGTGIFGLRCDRPRTGRQNIPNWFSQRFPMRTPRARPIAGRL